MRILRKMFGENRHREAAYALYGAAVARAREPGFYTVWGVPDTVEGRFDMIILHVYAVMRRLRGQGAPAEALSQALFDVLFDDVDQNLRELGVGDMGIGRRVKDMVASFYGRVGAYDDGLADGAAAETLVDALRRNVYLGGADGDAEALAGYLRSVVAGMETAAVGDLLGGTVAFAGAAP